MVAVQVAPPVRKPRAGGIKSVVGDFTSEPRLAVADIAWEDSGCGFPNATQAGCYDVTFPLTYTPVEVDDGGVAYTFTRNSDGTVDVEVTVGDAATPEGFTAPWKPTDAVDETVGDGNVLITTDGAVTYGTAPTGTASFSYDTTDRSGGTVPDKDADGVIQRTAIGPAFAQYAGVKCFLGGDSEGPSYQEQAVALLQAGEDRKVEDKLWSWAADADDTGSAASVVAAIALAEATADDSYVGQPVLLVGRDVAVTASSQNVLVDDGGVLRTINGTPVIASSAHDDVAVIGWPTAYASPLVTGSAPDLRSNVAVAIAERVYVLAVDCDYRYFVTVTGE